MNINSTTVAPATISTIPSPGSSTPLAVGLTLFFLLLLIVTGVIVYKYHSKIRNVVQFGLRRSQKNEDYSEAEQDDSQRYASMYTEQSVAQTPIYENLNRTTGYNSPDINQSRSPVDPEDDLYLQCDIADDAIYSNDPKCNLDMLPDSQEDDVYIMPDS